MRKEKVKKILSITALVILTIIFFSYNIVICVDSSHYTWLSNLIGDRASFQNWDVARGIVFPMIIHILTVICGENVISLQIGMFIAYVTVLGVTYEILKEMDEEFKFNKFSKIALIILAVFLIILNPLIYGYYHVILTEFVSMTACIVASYFAWKWIECNFETSKIKYIIYTLYFGCSMAFMWHLKQPYVLTILAPVIISIILSYIKNWNWKNVLQRAVSLVVCGITLLVSIKLWNFTLVHYNVVIDQGRTSSGFLSGQILAGMTEYHYIEDKEEYTKEKITENEKISQEDKDKINEIIDGNSKQYKNYALYECANNTKIKVLYSKEEAVSVAEALKFEMSAFFEDPNSIIKGYVCNYFTTIGLFKAQTVEASAVATYELTWSDTYENSFIGYNTYREMINDLGVPEYYYSYIENYVGVNRQIKFVNMYMTSLSLITIYTFKLFLLASPILAIAAFIKFIVLKVKKYENKKLRIYELLTILYGYAFLNVLMNAVLGALIDRYVISSYIAVNLALLIHFGYLCTMIIEKIKLKQAERK